MRFQSLNSSCDLASKDEKLTIPTEFDQLAGRAKFFIQTRPEGNRVS